MDYRQPEIVKARSKAYALLLQWAREAEQREAATAKGKLEAGAGKLESNSQGNSGGN